jgi:PAS domain S-box-containing protein
VDIDVDISEYKRIMEALRRSEKRYRGLFMESPISLWDEDFSAVRSQIDQLREAGVTDLRRYFEHYPEAVGKFAALIKVVDVNQATLDLYKAGSKTQLKQNLDKVLTEESHLLIREEIIDLFEGKKQITREGFNRNLEGEKIYLELGLSVAPGYEDTWSKVLISIVDITERKQAELALNEERNFINAILDNAAIVVNVLDREGRFVLVNKYFEQVTGYSASELEGRSIWDTTLPEDEAQALKPYFNELWEGIFPKVINDHVLTRTGEQVPFEWINTLIADNQGKPRYSLGIGLGLTQRQKMEEQLRASLAEKEILLREVHHRVKNNLEVINSLAEMQTRKINDPEAIVSLRQLQERIRTIALVHENLYRSENLAEVRAQPYLEKLTGNLYQAFGWPKLSLRAQAEDLIIPLDQAVPFGLIVTVLVTNGLKHAFPPEVMDQTTRPDRGKHRILVTLRLEDDQNILEVSDNGVGLPTDLDWRNTRSLGLRLVNRLTE